MATRPSLAGESGSGSIVAVAIMAAVVALVALSIPLYTVLVAKHAVMGAADATALAAADVAVGLVPGVPCKVAATVAKANGTKLAACEVDGLIVTVRVSGRASGIDVVAAATAGPPGSSRD